MSFADCVQNNDYWRAMVLSETTVEDNVYCSVGMILAEDDDSCTIERFY